MTLTQYSELLKYLTKYAKVGQEPARLWVRRYVGQVRANMELDNPTPEDRKRFFDGVNTTHEQIITLTSLLRDVSLQELAEEIQEFIDKE